MHFCLSVLLIRDVHIRSKNFRAGIFYETQDVFQTSFLKNEILTLFLHFEQNIFLECSLENARGFHQNQFLQIQNQDFQTHEMQKYKCQYVIVSKNSYIDILSQ